MATLYAWPLLSKARASEGWPVVSAVIIESVVEKSRRSRVSKPGGSRPSQKYKAHVVYEYTVDGQQFACDNIWFGSQSSSSRMSSQRVVSRYPVRKKVEVHYMPSDPSEAVLLPGAYFSSHVPLLISVGMLIAGLAVVRKPFLAKWKFDPQSKS